MFFTISHPFCHLFNFLYCSLYLSKASAFSSSITLSIFCFVFLDIVYLGVSFASLSYFLFFKSLCNSVIFLSKNFCLFLLYSSSVKLSLRDEPSITPSSANSFILYNLLTSFILSSNCFILTPFSCTCSSDLAVS